MIYFARILLFIACNTGIAQRNLFSQNKSIIVYIYTSFLIKCIEVWPLLENYIKQGYYYFSGDFKENILHIYAHMLEFAKGNKDFRLKVAAPKMGKV